MNEYKTKDLAEASFILASKVRLLTLTREGKICWFVFENKTLCEKLANSFWFNDAPIPSKSFYEAIQTLKNRIFSTK